MRKPQRVRVYEYMKKHNGITTMQAYGDLKITRLSARIFDLKQLGVKIDKEHIVKKKEGERIEYDRYFVAADNQIAPSHKEEQSGDSQAQRQDIRCSEQALQEV